MEFFSLDPDDLKPETYGTEVTTHMLPGTVEEFHFGWHDYKFFFDVIHVSLP